MSGVEIAGVRAVRPPAPHGGIAGVCYRPWRELGPGRLLYVTMLAIGGTEGWLPRVLKFGGISRIKVSESPHPGFSVLIRVCPAILSM